MARCRHSQLPLSPPAGTALAGGAREQRFGSIVVRTHLTDCSPIMGQSNGVAGRRSSSSLAPAVPAAPLVHVSIPRAGTALPELICAPWSHKTSVLRLDRVTPSRSSAFSAGGRSPWGLAAPSATEEGLQFATGKPAARDLVLSPVGAATTAWLPPPGGQGCPDPRERP